MIQIKISEITVQNGRRKTGDISELAESINQIGLISPIAVTDDFILIAGMHRLEACKSLGWEEIEANVLSLDDIGIQLAEIDENLIRNELSVLERSEQLKKRKDLYETQNPKTKHGAIGNGRSRDAESATLKFSKDTASKTLKSVRTIETDIQIANRISQTVRDVIRETPLADKKTELLLLTQFDSQTQTQVAQMFAEKKIETVEQGLREIAKQPLPTGFKTQAEISEESKSSAGYKWINTLYKAVLTINSIRKLGGIKGLTAKWSDKHKAQYAQNCREYAKTFSEYAEQIEETL